jgi:hypothetical protein
MTAQIIKLPYSVTRAAHSRKPRKSKNGTPEERAAKAAMETPPADVVDMSAQIDRRKLRSSPLRDHVATISFGATVVGKMRTAELRDEPLAEIEPEVRKEWLETLRLAIEAMETVGMGLVEARHTLKALRSEKSDFSVNLPVHALGQSVLNLAREDCGDDH